MTGKDLFESLSFIDERYIEEAEYCTLARKFPWLRVASLAACLCLLLLCIRPLVNTPQATVPPTTQPHNMPEGYLEAIVHVQEMTDEGFTGTVTELVLPEPFALGMKLNVVFEGDTWYEMADGSFGVVEDRHPDFSGCDVWVLCTEYDPDAATITVNTIREVQSPE